MVLLPKTSSTKCVKVHFFFYIPLDFLSSESLTTVELMRDVSEAAAEVICRLSLRADGRLYAFG